ncbi:flagellar export chaperone FliS [Paenibacillus sp. WLX1005]|uniref:flagellar export chaperone FliS n=1 Tax=Paenibacillus TaxID=44249 RepID=UPI00345AA278
MNLAFQKYQQSSVQTASPGQLIIMLYDGAIRFTKQGIVAINDKQYELANKSLVRAQAIINELTAALDHKYPISKELARLYEYMNYKLIQANIRKNAEDAEEIIGHLTELRDTWKECIRIVGSGEAVQQEVSL